MARGGGDRDRKRTKGDRKDAGRRTKKKVCIFCKEHIDWVDYKDVNLLRRFMSDRGKIRARRVSGNCAQHQRDVADGFARNYLVPKGLALRAGPGAVAQAASMRRAREVQDAREREAAEATARQLVPAVVRVPVRVGAEGRLFGSVTAADVVDAVVKQTRVELDRRRLHLDEPIRSLGTHEVPVKLHTDVEFRITVEVVAS